MTSVPDNVKPFVFHGLSLRAAGKNYLADCPMCDHEGKFSVEVSTSRYRCFACGAKGNALEFLRWLWQVSDASTAGYGVLASDRGLLYPDTPMHWGAARSVLTGDWLMPGHDPEGRIRQLYRYARVKERMVLLATPGFGHQLFGIPLYDPHCQVVYLCEGPWDAMALWEALGHAREGEEGLEGTADPRGNLLANESVLAVPGCSTFFPRWSKLFSGKTVNLMYDNDHPRRHPKTGQQIAPAGLEGMKRVAGILRGASRPPAQINYLAWSETDGYDTTLPSGYDVRDYLNAKNLRRSTTPDLLDAASGAAPGSPS